MTDRDRFKRPARFIAVGVLSAAVHFCAVVVAVEQAWLAPLWANLAGWLLAVGFSYGGHRRWTFADQAAPGVRSAARFFALSAAGFAINEIAYALLLRHGGLGYQAALAIVLLGVAGITYLLSRAWAFAGNPAPPTRAVRGRDARPPPHGPAGPR